MHSLNSLWPIDIIWRHRSGSVLVQVKACCLAVPSHYLNQCGLLKGKVPSPERHFTSIAPANILYNESKNYHYNDVTMSAMTSHITSLTIVNSTVYQAQIKKNQSSVSLAFMQGIHRWPVNSPHKWPVTRKMFPFDDVIMTFIVTSRRDRWVAVVLILTAALHERRGVSIHP